MPASWLGSAYRASNSVEGELFAEYYVGGAWAGGDVVVREGETTLKVRSLERVYTAVVVAFE